MTRFPRGGIHARSQLKTKTICHHRTRDTAGRARFKRLFLLLRWWFFAQLSRQHVVIERERERERERVWKKKHYSDRVLKWPTTTTRLFFYFCSLSLFYLLLREYFPRATRKINRALTKQNSSAFAYVCGFCMAAAAKNFFPCVDCERRSVFFFFFARPATSSRRRGYTLFFFSVNGFSRKRILFRLLSVPRYIVRTNECVCVSTMPSQPRRHRRRVHTHTHAHTTTRAITNEDDDEETFFSLSPLTTTVAYVFFFT